MADHDLAKLQQVEIMKILKKLATQLRTAISEMN